MASVLSTARGVGKRRWTIDHAGITQFSGCSARQHDFLQNFEDAPHGSAIFFEILRMLRTGVRFSSKSSGCSAWEHDFLQMSNEEDEPQRSSPVILNDEVDESFTKAILAPSARYRPFEPRKPPRTKCTGTRLV